MGHPSDNASQRYTPTPTDLKGRTLYLGPPSADVTEGPTEKTL